MKPWKIALVLLLAIALAPMAFAGDEIHRGFSTRAEPSRVEALVATTARQMAVRSNIETSRTPIFDA